MILRTQTFAAEINDENQQLVSLKRGDDEYMHDGGKNKLARGWANSEIIMFPIVGPAKDNRIETPRGTSMLPQHGIARYLKFHLTSATATSATYTAHYKANTIVHNDRVPDTRWPYSCTIEKTYTLFEQGLRMTIRVTNTDTEAMPMMLGWHPAFKLARDGHVYLQERHSVHSIRQHKQGIVAEGKTAGCDATPTRITILSDGNFFMLWSPPESNLICIEPISDPGKFEGIEHVPAELPAQRTVKFSTTILPE